MNALWDLLLQTEQQAKSLAGSILSTKNLRLQTEYMGTCRTKVTIHGVPIDISDDRIEAFFVKFGEVNEVKALNNNNNNKKKGSSSKTHTHQWKWIQCLHHEQ